MNSRHVTMAAITGMVILSGCSYFNPTRGSTTEPHPDCTNSTASTPGCDDTKSVGASPAGVPASPH